jgi:hydrogenase maturation protease
LIVAESGPAGQPSPAAVASSSAQAAPSTVVIGVGNALRHDDAAGLEVARRVRALVDPSRVAVIEHEGEQSALLDLWEGAAAVVLVDAVRSVAPAGTIHRVDASNEPLPAETWGSHSTHAIGVAEAVELARALGRMPARVIVYGIEGARFDAGQGLSKEVSDAMGALSDALSREVRSLTG